MKIKLIVILLIIINTVFSLTLDFENIDITVIHADNYTELKSSNPSQYNEIIGTPAIPLNVQIVEIPYNKFISQVEIIPDNITSFILDNQIKAVPENIPLSKDNVNLRAFSNNIDLDKSRQIFQTDWNYKTLTGILGSKKFVLLSWYSAKYDPDNNELIIPKSFHLNLQLEDSKSMQQLNNNYSTNVLAEKLGGGTKDNYSPVYLVIYPEAYLGSIEPLTNWRYLQGLQVHQISVEEISSQFDGIDLQTKIRNCIIQYYQEYGISHVTLVGDVDQLPDRKLYAFDCAFGAYEDENNIPADIYYAGLNGDWDSNGNGIYGEDDDEPDFLPEIFVSRIPASDPDELNNYLAMLLPYEKGEFSNFNKAGGFSMELWPESGSYLCQQFIYDNYFPDDYQIDFIYHDENTTDNAYAIINGNRNIVQHTGHAGKTILSLQNGYIRNENLENMANDWGGIFYSIGCWSAALDYDSVGENLVTWTDHGFLGYVGNSRYGWGAPSAPGFGFSEFYQKEFMRLIFEENITSLAELNTLQKLPFVPYWSGVSVYKWCGYELNALGDSYFNIQTHDPLDFSYNTAWIDNQLEISLYQGGMPLANVIVTCDSSQLTTDDSGVVNLSCDSNDIIHLYKKGYIYKTINVAEIQSKPYICNILNFDFSGYLQGSEVVFNFDLINPTNNDYNVAVDFGPENQFLTVELDSDNMLLAANSTISNIQALFKISDIAETEQLENGFNLPIMLRILNSATNEIISQRSFGITIKAPQLDVTEFQYNTSELDTDINNEFRISVVNNGDIPVYGISMDFNSEEVFFLHDQLADNNIINPGESVVFYNSWQSNGSLDVGLLQFDISTTLGENSYSFVNNYYISISNIALEENFEQDLYWDSDPYWQRVSNYASEGDFSLSCRPEFPGNYELTIPTITYLNDSFVEFNYRYKMPMYGKDGVYLILETDSFADTLLFLGAGGALPEVDREDAQVYIESDWAEYQLNIAENTSYDLQSGEQYNLIFRFVYFEEIEGFNQYNLMDEIGIFIDQFKLGESWSDFIQPFTDKITLDLYPNPITDFHWLAFRVFSGSSETIKIEIYNTKGQKIRSLPINIVNQGENLFFWDKKDKFNRKVAAGIYLLKIKIANQHYYRKVLILN